MSAPPRHASVTHLHLLACLNTLLGDRPAAPGAPLRVLDIGCGDGRLMAYLQAALAVLHPERTIELHGFDVREQGWGVVDEYLRAVRRLEAACPSASPPWRDRVRLVSARDPWPFPEDFFDAAVSNVVLEHVADADLFLGSLRRVLKPDGVSVHLFPLAHGVVEGHVKVPFAHWFRDVDQQRAWIALANRLGLGRWRTDRAIFGETDLAAYARSQAAYLNTATHYRGFGELHALCRRHDLTLSHRFTRDFYRAKLGDLLRLRPRLRYRAEPLLVVDTACFLALRHVSAATLVMAPVSYDVAARVHAEAEARSAARPGEGRCHAG